MRFTEEQLKQYAAPLSTTEDMKCKRAIEAIRDALKDLGYTDDQKPISLLESDTLAYSVSMRGNYSEKVSVFIQGSYANNTCVRGESDVDIAVVREDSFEYAFGKSFMDSATTKEQKEAIAFKNAVEHVLKSNFSGYVQRKNKSIKVDGNTYRKQADTVPCVAMHYYYNSDLSDFSSYKDGIVIYADDGAIIRNFPKQHIANGKAKNSTTNFYYKKMVRIIKKMRYLMSEYGYTCADKVSSFGLESLLWNLPDDVFMKYSTYQYKFGYIVQYLYEQKFMLRYYKEANGIKTLCPTEQDVDNYKSFIDALLTFYQYGI